MIIGSREPMENLVANEEPVSYKFVRMRVMIPLASDGGCNFTRRRKSHDE